MKQTWNSILSELLATEEPADLGPRRRPGTLSTAEIDARLEGAWAPSARELLRAVIYLWHDHLDEAHQIVQDIENADGSLAHAIMHRREPDFGNAKYWFRRAGRRPSFLSLAVRASETLEKAGGEALQKVLLPNNSWDPLAFVDAVERASGATAPVLKQVQKMEFEALIKSLAEPES